MLWLVMAGHGSQASAQVQLSWRVEAPFRLFPSGSASEMHVAAWRKLSGEDRQRPVLAVERVLALEHPWGWAEGAYRAVCWDDTRQQYGCAAHSDYAHPQFHRVRIDIQGIAQAPTCRWTLSASAVAPRSGVCRETMTVDIPYPGGATVSISADGHSVATAEIKVKDLLVVGLGDSFASGDGNPDAPVRFDDSRTVAYGPPNLRGVAGYPARAGNWAEIGDASFAQHEAGWHARSCHRSLYGHQLRAALQLSIEDPHRAVTFAGFACWGSDSIEGLLMGREPSSVTPGLPPASQITAAARLQCGPRPVERRRWARAYDMGGQLPRLADLEGERCPPASARAIDILLLTIGGNDIGFAQVVANAVLADRTPLRDIAGWLGSAISAREAQTAIPELALRFKALNRAFHTILHLPWSEPQRIVLTAYPTIALQDDGSDACRSGQEGMTVMPDFALDQRRARDSEKVAGQLYLTMRSLAREHGWSFVDAHRAEFVRHGVCAGAYAGIADPADDVRFPRFIDGGWRPYPPSQWQPYAPRRRWIRTPNDGFLTGHFHGPGFRATPLNLLLAASYSGGFHPTAEGQAAIADAVVDKVRAVLAGQHSPHQ